MDSSNGNGKGKLEQKNGSTVLLLDDEFKKALAKDDSLSELKNQLASLGVSP